MNLVETLRTNPSTLVFEATDWETREWQDWQLRPLERSTVLYDENGGVFIVRAIQVLERGRSQDCYIDLFLLERIADSAYFTHEGAVRRNPIYEVEGDVIPAVAIESFGVYELFYSRIDPEVGLNVLRTGLQVAESKAPIAEDLGYILRDEGRTEEAIDAFSIAIDDGPSSVYIARERATLFEAIGDHVNAERDRQLAVKLGELYAQPSIVQRLVRKLAAIMRME